MRSTILVRSLFLFFIGSLLSISVACANPWETLPRVVTPAVNPADLNFTVPTPEPTLPGGIDTFEPPYVPTTTTGPLISELQRTAGADETLALSGENFVNGTTRFDFFAQTNSLDWNHVTAAPLYTSAQTSAVTVPKNFPAWSMYLVWPNNSNTRGKPFAVNRTEAWWIGLNQAVAGQTISIYGRNLAKNNGTSTSFVYIKPAGSAGTWVTPTSVNPYKVDVTVPTLSAGDYEVWTHNGHGGHFGWSGPLTLTVLAQSPWDGMTTNIYNVKTYGALGDGSTDDGAAIEAAMTAAAANAPATVYFPAGTYMSHRTFDIAERVRWAGAGRDLSFLKMAVTSSSISAGAFINGSADKFMIEDLTIDADNKIDAWPGAMIFIGSADFKVINSRLSARGHGTMEVNARRMVFENVEMIGTGSFVNSSSQMFINNCNFRMTNDGEYAIANWGGKDISLTNNHLYNDNESLTTGHGIGRIFVGQGHFGSLRNTYFSGNETHNSAPRDCNVVDCNKGEQILVEFGNNEYKSAATAVTANTVTFSSVSTDPTLRGGIDVIVVAGKGLGQHRRVLSVSSGTLTLDRDWDVLPNTSTSRFLIGAVSERSVVYNNTFQGRTTHTAHDSASTAVNVFGSSFDFIIDKNNISRMRHGLMVVSHTSNDGSPHSPIYFNRITNNQITDGFNGIYGGHVYGYDFSNMYGSIGNVFAKNTISNMTHIGFTLDQWDATGNFIDSTVLEKNTITNVPYGLLSGLQLIWSNTSFSSAPDNGTRLLGTVLRENKISLGTATYSGSIGFRTDLLNTWVNKGTTWNGFATGNP